MSALCNNQSRTRVRAPTFSYLLACKLAAPTPKCPVWRQNPDSAICEATSIPVLWSRFGPGLGGQRLGALPQYKAIWKICIFKSFYIDCRFIHHFLCNQTVSPGFSAKWAHFENPWSEFVSSADLIYHFDRLRFLIGLIVFLRGRT